MEFKKRILVIFAIMGFCSVSHSQVGVGTLSPANSSQLDITSANKGLLIPRISLTGTTNQSPVTGSVINSLLVYNTATANDVTPGFYYWQVNKWVRIMAQSDPEILTSLSYDRVNNRLIYLDEKGISTVLQLDEQVGPQGPQGPVGLTGPQGPIGLTGADGPQGPIGLTGATGPQGVPGNDGATGPQGPIGLTGADGPQGPIGLTGATGPQGIAGNDGATGPQGPIGLTGADGPQGPIGLTGATGPQGIAGNDGATGPQGPIGLTGADGPQGPIGLTGATGPQGIAGNDGATGPQGPIGLTGADGPQGPIGLTGATGPQGVPGNDGATGPQGPIGLTGADGPQGPIGLTGATGPQGIPGNDGATGPQGPTGPQGGVGLIVDGINTIVAGTGTAVDPYQINTQFPATTVSNTSLNNTLSTTVNGVVSSGVPIVNTNQTSLTGTSLTTTVNGVASTALDLTPAITAGQITTNLSQATGSGIITYTNEEGTAQTALLRSTDPGNIIAIGTDGGALLTAGDIPAVTSVSNASTANTATVTVNGVVSSGAPIVNTNETSIIATNLITRVNNVASTPLDLTPLLRFGTTNELATVNGNLVSVVNGVPTYPFPILITAINGLNGIDGKVGLGGTLNASTVITTSATNTLAIAGLQSGIPSDNIVVVNPSGVLRTISPTSLGVNSVSNNSTANLLTTAVNGLSGTPVTIINSNAASLSGANLTTTVNGVNSNVLDLAPAIAAGQINTNLGQDTATGIITYTNEQGTAQTASLRSTDPGNIIAIGTDGGTLLTAAEVAGVTSVSNASAANTATVTVNGVVSSGAPIVNSNQTSLSGSSLTTTVNGVASTALNLAPAIAAATTNTLTATNGALVSTVNGVATTPAVPVLTAANNGLTATNGNVQLGGPLLNRTVIMTDPANTLVLDGLQYAFGNEDLVVVDFDGTLRKLPARQNDFFYWRTEGNFGIDPNRNFLGTWDDADLVFKRNNIISGRLSVTNTSFGVNALPNAVAATENVAIGASALLNNSSGSRNSALGYFTLTANTTGIENTGSGYFALNSNTSGSLNTAFGNSALRGNIAGSMNTAIGYSAGSLATSGDNNTLIGADTGMADGLTFATAIGSGAYVAASNSLILGGANISVGIGTDAPTHTFHVRPIGGFDPIRIEGLLPGLPTNNIVVTDLDGVFKQVPRTIAFSAKSSLTIDATVSTPTKAPGAVNDFIRYRDLGNNEVEVDFLYSAINSTGASAGSGDYLFELPNGYQFDLNEQPIYNGPINSTNPYPLEFALRDVKTVHISANFYGSSSGYIIPFSSTLFRILGTNSAAAVGGVYPLTSANEVIGGRFTFVRQ